MISDDQLKEWRALAEKATPGPWMDYERDGIVQAPHYEDRPISVFVNCRKDDRAFLIASRTAVPELLAEIDELLKAVRIRNTEAMIFRRERDDFRAKLDRAKVVLKELAQQRLVAEIETEDDGEFHADLEGAYDIMIGTARAALSEIDE